MDLLTSPNYRIHVLLQNDFRCIFFHCQGALPESPHVSHPVDKRSEFFEQMVKLSLSSHIIAEKGIVVMIWYHSCVQSTARTPVPKH